MVDIVGGAGPLQQGGVEQGPRALLVEQGGAGVGPSGRAQQVAKTGPSAAS